MEYGIKIGNQVYICTKLVDIKNSKPKTIPNPNRNPKP